MKTSVSKRGALTMMNCTSYKVLLLFLRGGPARGRPATKKRNQFHYHAPCRPVKHTNSEQCRHVREHALGLIVFFRSAHVLAPHKQHTNTMQRTTGMQSNERKPTTRSIGTYPPIKPEPHNVQIQQSTPTNSVLPLPLTCLGLRASMWAAS